MTTEMIDKKPQTLLTRGKESFVTYHSIGNDKIDSGIMVEHLLNKISITQIKKLNNIAQ